MDVVGCVAFGAMFSLDALFTGQRGYPLLFQTGESAHSVPLVDRQHPHDLFSALEVSYAHSFNKKSDAYLYVGYPGELSIDINSAYLEEDDEDFDHVANDREQGLKWVGTLTELIVGGCVMSADPSDYRCSVCGHEFSAAGQHLRMSSVRHLDLNDFQFS